MGDAKGRVCGFHWHYGMIEVAAGDNRRRGLT